MTLTRVPTGGLNVGEFRKVLMKTGLVLVVLGHVSFIAAAVLHGTMLRFVAAARDAVVLQYCVVDILSVTSAIVVWPGWEAVKEGGTRSQPESQALTLVTVYRLDRHANSLCLSSVKWGGESVAGLQRFLVGS